MYMLFERKRGQKKWSRIILMRTLHLAKNGMLRKESSAKFFVQMYTDCNPKYEYKYKKI